MIATTIVFFAIGMFSAFCSFASAPAFLTFIFLGLSIGFGVWGIASMANGKKNVGCGVCTLIFTSMIGGILYLCWKPEVIEEKSTFTVEDTTVDEDKKE